MPDPDRVAEIVTRWSGFATGIWIDRSYHLSRLFGGDGTLLCDFATQILLCAGAFESVLGGAHDNKGALAPIEDQF